MPALLSGRNRLTLIVDKHNEDSMSANGLVSGAQAFFLTHYTKICIKDYINPEEIPLFD